MVQFKAEPLGLPGTKDYSTAVLAPAGHGRVYVWERRLLARLLTSLGQPPIRVILWDGEEIDSTDGTPLLTITFHDRRALLATVFDARWVLGMVMHRDGLRSRGLGPLS